MSPIARSHRALFERGPPALLLVSAVLPLGFALRFAFTEGRWSTAHAPLGALVVVAALAGTRRFWVERVADLAPRQRVAVVLILAVALRLGAFFAIETTPHSDFAVYLDLARGLVESQTFGVGGPENARPPGWPLLLAVFDGSGLDANRAGRLANVGFGAVTAGLLAHWGDRLGGAACGLVAGLAFAVLPAQVLLTTVLATEPLFGLLLTWAVLQLAGLETAPRRARSSLVAGLALGAAALVRPQAFVVGPAFLGLWILGFGLRAERVKAAALVACGVGVVLLPWALRNQLAFGQLTPFNRGGGLAAYMANHPEATGTHIDLADWSDQALARSPREVRDREGWARARRWIRENPADFLATIPDKYHHLFRFEHDAVWLSLHTASEGVRAWERRFLQVTHLGYLVLLGLAGLGSLRWLRRAGASSLLAPATVVLCWLAMHTVFHGQGRYHAPLVPFWCLAAGLFFAPAATGRVAGARAAPRAPT